MSQFKMTRRDLLVSSAAVAAASAFDLDVHRAQAASNKLVRVRGSPDIQILDPGYMIGGMEIPVDYATLPRLAISKKTPEGWSWEPAPFVDKIEQVDPTHIAF